MTWWAWMLAGAAALLFWELSALAFGLWIGPRLHDSSHAPRAGACT